MKKILFFFLFQILATGVTFAQDDKLDFMRNSGKIYVVFAVILSMFIGIIAYLIYLDRKLTRLENQIHN